MGHAGSLAKWTLVPVTEWTEGDCHVCRDNITDDTPSNASCLLKNVTLHRMLGIRTCACQFNKRLFVLLKLTQVLTIGKQLNKTTDDVQYVWVCVQACVCVCVFVHVCLSVCAEVSVGLNHRQFICKDVLSFSSGDSEFFIEGPMPYTFWWLILFQGGH